MLLHQLEDMFHYQEDVIESLESKIATLKSAPTFAQITSQKSPSTVSTFHQDHVILVKPKNVIHEDHHKTSNEIRATVTSIVNPATLGIGIRNVNNIYGGGIRISLNSNDDCKKLVENLNKDNAQNLVASIPQKKQPRVIIYGVPKYISQDDLILNLCKQNTHVNDAVNGNMDVIKIIKSISSKRNTDEQHWIFEVTPKLRNLVLKLNYINMGWKRCRVADRLLIIQCWNCAKFGHFASECKSNSQKCTHCASDHAFKNCTKKELQPHCVNCTNHAKKINKSINCNHSAIDHRCPEYQKVRAKIMSKINYNDE
jgi:hypothetical protein